MNWKMRIALRLVLAAGMAVTALARAAHGEEGVVTPPGLTPPRLVTAVGAQLDGDLESAPRPAPIEIDLEITLTRVVRR